MSTGAVSFHNDKLVRRVYIPTRENAIVNRLLKTKVVKDVDHEAERIERLREEGRGKKLKANELVRSPPSLPSFIDRPPSGHAKSGDGRGLILRVRVFVLIATEERAAGRGEEVRGGKVGEILLGAVHGGKWVHGPAEEVEGEAVAWAGR